ncbi:MAG TPA: SDR family oxidoreductase [Candidatus Acidoferrales bacterium]|nr:SDR family oxidoreductase [Candidatus Acidoferrales bacterium]
MDLFDLSGIVAAVIGGTGVLGGALSHGLGSAGAAIAVMGRSADRGAARVEALHAQGVRAAFVEVDATDAGSLEAARREAEERLGPVTVLVNAPGMNSSTPFFDIELSEWHQIIDANLTSVFLACQVFGRSMIANGLGGSIINLSSSSSGPPLSKVFTYSVSKAGLNNLTQYLARELAPYAIRVNAIAPGFLPAEQNRSLLSEERVRAILGHTPVARLGEPDELVGAAVWLASGRASGYVTGSIVRVDGGFSAMTI